MAGLPGKSGPPSNQNAFRHGLAGISQRRINGVLNPVEQSIQQEILTGLLADQGGKAQSAPQSTCCRRLTTQQFFSIELGKNLERFFKADLTRTKNSERY